MANLANLVLRAGSGFNGFGGKDCELFWSTGRFWAFKSEICILKSKITGLHHSSRLPQEGKTIEAPSGDGTKPTHLGPDSLL